MPTRRDFLKQTVASAAITALSDSAYAASQSSSQIPIPRGDVHVFVTDATRRHAETAELRWATANSGATSSAVTIDPSMRFQPVLGFGGALTDAACYVLNQMREPARTALMHELFDPAQMAFSVCRICVGSSDYSRNVFSYDEGAPDPELARFSIAHDRDYILPTLRAARQINPDLFLLASPWSPPGWMKDNNSMLGGTISRRYMKAYANYIVKFLQAYEQEGVEINATSPQNEVDTDQDSLMPACLFPQEVEVEYVGEILGPAIQHSGLKTRIWMLDHNYNLWGRAICQLDDDKVRQFTNAIAWHGYLGTPELVSNVAQAHPLAEMYWTEGGPDITDPHYLDNWVHWSKTFTGILRNGIRCIIAWNVALDENGKPNIGPFSCGGVVTVHSQTQEIVHSGQYCAFAHFSRHIRRDATVIASDGDVAGVDHLAAANPDGSYVAVLTNSGAGLQQCQIHFGNASLSMSLPANSITTLSWS